MLLPTIKSKLILFTFIISSLLVILSIVSILRLIPDLLDDQIIKNVRLDNGTKQYERFLAPPFPISFKLYFFNVENPSDILIGKKPILKEVGPYIYKEYRKKYMIGTDETDDTITTLQNEKFEFDQRASGNLSDDDVITILNLPLNAALQIAEKTNMAGIVSSCTKAIFGSMNTIFINAKVKDLVFDGIKFCAPHFSLCVIPKNAVCKMAEKIKNVDKLQDNTLQFSLFNYKQLNSDGFHTVKRGIKDIHLLGELTKWNNMQYTHYWNRTESESSCDKIEGSDGTLFPPMITQDLILKTYSSDACRTFSLRFFKKVVYRDIKAYLFQTNKMTLRSSTEDPEDDCFCIEETFDINGQRSCFLDGLIDMQSCTGSPVLLSNPHFLWANQSYLDGVIGLMPNEEKHKTYLIIEPNTGTPLEGVSRTQINAVLRPIKHNTDTKNAPRVVLPIFWLEESASIPDEYLDELHTKYFDIVEIVDIAKWCFLGISLILMLTFGSYFIYKIRS